jgi:hypothetical protein
MDLQSRPGELYFCADFEEALKVAESSLKKSVIEEISGI